MKAKEVLKELNITRPTLCSYVQKGYIKAIKLPNGQYDYIDQSIYEFRTQQVGTSETNADKISIQEQKLALLEEMHKLNLGFYNWLVNINFMGSSRSEKLKKLLAEYDELTEQENK